MEKERYKLVFDTTRLLSIEVFSGFRRALSQYQIKQISWFCSFIISYFSVVSTQMRLKLEKISCCVFTLEDFAIQALNFENKPK